LSGDASAPVSAALRERIGALAVTRFRPLDAVRTLEQECFIPYPLERVSVVFRGRFLTLLPPNLQRTQPIGDGPLAVGSRLIATPMYLTRPMVAVEIIAMNEERFAYAYLEGGPFQGRNTVCFSRDGLGTIATVTLRYQFNGFLPALGWTILGGGRFHRRLIAEGFKTLQRLLAGGNDA
jgi:hypothetical protein